MRFFAQLLSFALLWCSVSASSAHQARNRRHGRRLNSDLAVRAPGDVDMYKRDFTNARFTYYAVGLGACGTTNQPGDFIVALNAMVTISNFCVFVNNSAAGENCYKEITITYNGLTASAQIVDECMGCPYGGLDFSEGLFQFFTPLGSGVISGSWSFGSAPAPLPLIPTSSLQLIPTPTTTWQPPPTTTPLSPSTTSSPSPTPSPSSPSSSLSSSSSSTSTTLSSSLSSASSTASSTTIPASAGSPSVFMNLNLAMVYLGELLDVAQT
ncbi:hypothetical protein EDD22DRAFT_891572 [Suillus occidentalis]|nr:hypothetical protein EDD22DRAFT_891572 [Suillus occidentalis]